ISTDPAFPPSRHRAKIRAMDARLAALALVPLLAVEAPLSNAEGARQPFPDPHMMQQLREAQDLALRAGQDLARSFAILQQAIPRFGVPYLDEHGNIVIPRLAPAPHGTPVPDPGPDRL
ncbi:MAG: hypothetical protein ACREFQ_15345, partial [Stellaceae bacterium]